MAPVPGYTGKIVRVDLSWAGFGEGSLDQATLRKWLGGVSLGAMLATGTWCRGLRAAAAQAPGRRRVPVTLAGHLCIAPRFEVLAMLENARATVVDDHIFVGREYIALDARETGNPIEALVDRFLAPDPTAPPR